MFGREIQGDQVAVFPDVGKPAPRKVRCGQVEIREARQVTQVHEILVLGVRRIAYCVSVGEEVVAQDLSEQPRSGRLWLTRRLSRRRQHPTRSRHLIVVAHLTAQLLGKHLCSITNA